MYKRMDISKCRRLLWYDMPCEHRALVTTFECEPISWILTTQGKILIDRLVFVTQYIGRHDNKLIGNIDEYTQVIHIFMRLDGGKCRLTDPV